MTHFIHLKIVNRTISSSFPRINKPHFLETSIDTTYTDTYFPINSWQNDKFIEFRIPRSGMTFIDLNNIHLQLQLQVFKKTCSSEGEWSGNVKTETGEHFDLVNATLYTIFKSLSIELNNIELVNISNYSLNSYLRLITQFSEQDINKVGRLIHIENYDSIQNNLNSDAYFSGLTPSSAIYKRLVNLRDKGLYLHGPLLSDLNSITDYLLDGVDLIIRLSMPDNPFIFFTNQQNPTSNENGKKYSFNLSNISLNVLRVKPTENAYSAMLKSLNGTGNYLPTLDYVFMSKVPKTYHIPNGVTEFNVDLPYSQTIPEKVFICFQTYDNFNTRDYKFNGLYLNHLNLSQININVNGSTLYNVKSNFKTGNCSELYYHLLNCIEKENIITYDNFKSGMTLLGFNLTNFDPSGNIRNPFYGVLRITMNFTPRLADNAMCYILGDVLSILSINKNRELKINTN